MTLLVCACGASDFEAISSRSHTPGSLSRSPTHRNLSRSPTHRSLSRSPTPGSLSRSPTHQSLSRSPTHRSLSRSPTPLSLSRSPTRRSRSSTPRSRSPTPRSRSPTPRSRSPTPRSQSPTPRTRSPSYTADSEPYTAESEPYTSELVWSHGRIEDSTAVVALRCDSWSRVLLLLAPVTNSSGSFGLLRNEFWKFVGLKLKKFNFKILMSLSYWCNDVCKRGPNTVIALSCRDLAVFLFVGRSIVYNTLYVLSVMGGCSIVYHSITHCVISLGMGGFWCFHLH